LRRLPLLLLLLLASRGRAETADGGEGAAWLKLGVGARPLALGQASVADEGDVYDLNGNPAGLVSLSRIALGSQAALLSEDRRMDNLSFARPLDLKLWKPGIGLSVSRFSLEAPIERRDTNTPDPVGDWFQSSYSVQLGLGSWIGDPARSHSALGLNFRFLSESVGDASGSGEALDLGSLYRVTSWLNLGWSLENLLSRSDWSTGSSEDPPKVFHGGAAAWLWQRRLWLGAEYQKSEVEDPRLRAGVECWLSPGLFAVRLGLDQDRYSAGLGLLFSIQGDALSLDYAIRTDPVLPEQPDQRFSLGLAFDP